MGRTQAGFALVFEIILVVAVVAVAATVFVLRIHKSTHSTGGTTASVSSNPPLKLKSIGFDLDYYNPATGMAGDIKFEHYNFFADEIVGIFGQHDPRSQDPAVRNPQPTFVLAAGTKIQSLVDGVVANVKTLYSGDSTIMVTTDGTLDSNFIYETEHVINVRVKKGDHVKGGQVIAEVSPHGAPGPGIGIVDIGILHPQGSEAGHVCPFQYMDDSIKNDINKKLTALYQSWNQYEGKQVYNPSTFVSPGCVTEDWVKG